MLKKGLVLSILVGLSLSVLPTTSSAYVLNSKKVSHPKDTYYWIDPAFSSTHQSNIESGINTWDVTPEVQFTKRASLPGGADIMIERSNTSKGNIMGTSYGGGHIILWSGWRGLDASDEKETVVHEVGHELGLAHTQASNDSIAVMREDGFNGKPKPLSDDIKGIAKKY